MCENNTPPKIALWKFLADNTIEIPIIQRDYAQGRLGKEYLRQAFLTDIKKALDNKTELKLDFVYGSVEKGKLYPLDGQQRLTTLWLLHWYIALMSGNLNEKVCVTLRKFTYETRISSREFCQNLCKPDNFENYKDYKPTKDAKRKVVEFITSRTWSYSAWKQDPTIQSMLRMLGGTVINDKKNNDIVDGLEELFYDTTDFAKYWNILISDTAPIVFYQLPLTDFGLSDDLYIKMNARGKQLTNFENFKADLVGYIRNQDWVNLLDSRDSIPIKLDTDWTDIFWKNRLKSDNRIDDIYFAFLNRFFFCEMICQNTDNTEDELKSNPIYKYLYGDKDNDRTIEYDGFEKYRYFNDEIPKSFFQNLETVLDRLPRDKELNEYFPKWVEIEFQFIPKYIDDNTITTLTQNGRVVFHAISKYLQKGKFDETLFKRWMRVVWNIVENSNASMIGTMRLIDELSKHSHDIYEFLASKEADIISPAAREQVEEEKLKAHQILYGNPRLDDKSWEEIIIEAEKYAFFKGAIRFLFRDNKGDFDWGEFDKKWESANFFFTPQGINDKWKKNANLLKVLLSHTNFSIDQMRDLYIFDNEKETWKKNILLSGNDVIQNAVSIILSGNTSMAENMNPELSRLCNSELLDWVSENLKGSRIAWHYNHWTLYPRGSWRGIFLDADLRDRALCKLQVPNNVIKIKNNISSVVPYYLGYDIRFGYNGGDYEWSWNGNIYSINTEQREVYKNEEDFIKELNEMH